MVNMLRWVGLILKPPAIEIKFTLTLGHLCLRMSNIYPFKINGYISSILAMQEYATVKTLK
jgi:hypothetical protein